MSYPKEYCPEEGQKYQLFCRSVSRAWEHCDYAKDKAEKKFLLGEYALAYQGMGFEFKTILLPAKYWPKAAKVTGPAPQTEVNSGASQ